MNPTKFPFETDEPQVDVVLPVGSHVLKLVIEDDAGTQSPPDAIAVTVEPAPPPKGVRIRTVSPRSGYTGQKGPNGIQIAGDNLRGTTEVDFYHHLVKDDNISADIQSTGTDYVDSFVSVSVNAEFGRRTTSVTTPSGKAHSPPDATFTVRPGVLQWAIMLLGLLAVVGHIALDFPNALFIGIGVLYAVLLVAMYAPIHYRISSRRSQIRWLLLVYTIAVIIIGLVVGLSGTLSYAALVVLVLLVVLFAVESQMD